MDIKYLTVERLNTKDLIRIFSTISINPTIAYNGTPCWTRTNSPCKGYVYTWNRISLTKELVHRFVYAWLIGPIPRGRKHGELDHLCRNRACCNPLHLELVPTKTNILRGEGTVAKNARKTHCKRGHPLSGDNLYIIPPGLRSGYRRSCRACNTKAKRDRIDKGMAL